MSSEHSRDADPSRPESWAERHAVTIMSAVLLGLLALVILVHVGC